MNRKKIINWLICVTAAIALAAVCQQLYSMRYRGADIHPQFSSFRSDPFGSKVLYKSLNRIESVKAVRNLRPLSEIKNPSASCILVIGAGRRIFRKNRELLKVAMNGGRVVICYSPFRMDSAVTRLKPASMTHGGKKRKLPLPGIVLKNHHFPPAFPVHAKPAKAVIQDRLPEISFYSAWYFHPQSKDWKSLFTVLDKPVLIERRYGSGTLVLCSDSFLLSNEAMTVKPSGKLLLFLLGGKKKVIFEETHLGAFQSHNISWLLSRYNLIWFLVALATTAGLFFWRSLTTPSDNDRPICKTPVEAIDNDSLAAPAGLFRKDFPARQLPDLCLDEFIHSGPGKRLTPAKRELMKSAIKKNHPLDAYNSCVKIYKQRETFTHDDIK